MARNVTHVFNIELEWLTREAQQYFSNLTQTTGQNSTGLTRNKLSGCIAICQLILQEAIYRVPRENSSYGDQLKANDLRTISALADKLRPISAEADVVETISPCLKKYKYVEEAKIWEFSKLLEVCGLSPQEATDLLPSVIRWVREQTDQAVIRLTSHENASSTPPSQSDLDLSKPATPPQEPDISASPIKGTAKSRRKAKILV